MPCDAACRKIIINSAFMAALAPAMANRAEFQAVERNAARRLGEAAKAHSAMTSVLGLGGSSDGFDGCDQALKLVNWINTPAKGDEGNGRAGLMDTWTADIWSSIADLAAGKLPT